ncbi:MAG: aspartate kinase [Mangrovibacterium sp.]
MKIYKFGGASVSSADAIRNVAEIVKLVNGKLIVVVSAMGKTTNALEVLVRKYCLGETFQQELQSIQNYHQEIMDELELRNRELPAQQWQQFYEHLQKKPSTNFDYEYDQIVSFGELLSTSIVSAFLEENKQANRWIDIRSCLITDSNYREANVDWEKTETCSKTKFVGSELFITQGFIGGTSTRETTTLGREGSDYSAAIVASVLRAESVSIWKNVPGVLNANPQDFDCTEKLDELSYKEAIELAYSGANIIHPKTMKPLHNKSIPLYVRSFEAPELEGTIIHRVYKKLQLPPIYIQKEKQALITLQTLDISFVSVMELADVFQFFKENRIKVNLIQQAAVQISFCIDEPEFNIEEVVHKLSQNFKVLYNNGLTLATIRFYDDESIERMIGNRTVLMQQKSRKTIKMVLQA